MSDYNAINRCRYKEAVEAPGGLIVAHRADRHPEAVLHSPLVLAVEVPPELLTVLPRGVVRGSELDELGMHRPDEADEVPQRPLACGRPQGSLGKVCEDIGVPPESVGRALVALLREQPLESIGGVQGLRLYIYIYIYIYI